MSRLFALLVAAMLLASCAASRPRVSEAGIPQIIPPPAPGSVQGDNVVAISMTTTTDHYRRKTMYDRQAHNEANGRTTYGPWHLLSDKVHRLDASESGHRADPCADDKSSPASAH